MKRLIATAAAGIVSAFVLTPLSAAAAQWNNVKDSTSHTVNAIVIHTYVRTKTTPSYIEYQPDYPDTGTDTACDDGSGDGKGYYLRIWDTNKATWLALTDWRLIQPNIYADPAGGGQTITTLTGYEPAGLKFQDADKATCSTTKSTQYTGQLYY